MTAKAAKAPGRDLDPLTGALADVIFELVFYLDNCDPDEVRQDIADGLCDIVAAALREIPVNDRLLFLEHAGARARRTDVERYQTFLLNLAEALGLE